MGPCSPQGLAWLCSFPLGRCGGFPRLPVPPAVPAGWLEAPGAGEMPAGAFLRADKPDALSLFGVAFPIALGSACSRGREWNSPRSHPCLRSTRGHTHTRVPLCNLVAADVPSVSFAADGRFWCWLFIPEADLSQRVLLLSVNVSGTRGMVLVVPCLHAGGFRVIVAVCRACS